MTDLRHDTDADRAHAGDELYAAQVTEERRAQDRLAMLRTYARKPFTALPCVIQREVHDRAATNRRHLATGCDCEHPMVTAFDFDGHLITDPFMDETDRFAVDPVLYYGMPFLASDFCMGLDRRVCEHQLGGESIGYTYGTPST